VRVLSLIHGPEARAGVFGEEVGAAGHELEERSFTLGNPPSRPADRYDAAMVFGGSMNVHEVDGHPWLADERAFIGQLLGAHVPVLGVCLGSQLLAAVAGADVTRAPEPEIGWYEVEKTPEAEGDPLLGALPPRFMAFQWHSYRFALPPGAVALGWSPVCLQAYRLGELAWGIQFHAEVTREICAVWISRYASDPDAVRIGVDRDVELARLDREIGRWNELGRTLVGGFLAVAAGRTAARTEPARA
jgi:GMP synthase-like glutamine amidotransferase